MFAVEAVALGKHLKFSISTFREAEPKHVHTSINKL